MKAKTDAGGGDGGGARVSAHRVGGAGVVVHARRAGGQVHLDCFALLACLVCFACVRNPTNKGPAASTNL